LPLSGNVRIAVSRAAIAADPGRAQDTHAMATIEATGDAEPTSRTDRLGGWLRVETAGRGASWLLEACVRQSFA